LDNIINLNDKNFYLEKQREINIFEFRKGRTNGIVTCDMLGKFYFSFTSIVDRIGKQKISIYRDLCQISRILAKSKPLVKISKNDKLQIMSPNEAIFQFQNIKGEDLLSLASGKLDP